VEARDGGDAPEDVHGALHRALQMEWDVGGSMTRVLVHIADAPCHGTKYHTLSGDSHPGGDPHGLKSAELLRGLRQLGVCYKFGRINESTDRMVRLFDEEAGGGYISECDVADCRAITKVVTTELRKSVCHTVEALLHGRAVGGASRHGPLASAACCVEPSLTARGLGLSAIIQTKEALWLVSYAAKRVEFRRGCAGNERRGATDPVAQKNSHHSKINSTTLFISFC
jgi:hypothetical protein